MNEAWWRKAVVYQIYPKSFNDTTGNGLGDIRGVIEKLDYIKKIGVDVIWLTPVYQSPQKDNGYDISNYFDIEPAYGTMEDFEELLKETHRRGMKLIMDLVINHTSTDHEWFQKSAESKESSFRDFYIWKDAVDGDVPNNWASKFGGSAWEFDAKTNQYYLHLFDRSQGDLNWENEHLREKLYDMMRFWAKKGIDGFRLDVINLISKNQSFPSDDTGDGRKFYTDGPRIHEFLRAMNQEVFSHYDMMTVGEMSSTTLENCVLYSRPERKELDMTFQFHHLKVDYPGGDKWTKAPFDFLELKRILSDWQVGMHEGGGWNALFWCNHDQPRAVSRFGNDGRYHKESAKMLATTLHMMQGTPYIYQGEEFGMTNPKFDHIDDYRDVESINAYESFRKTGMPPDEILEILKQKSRDNSRTPMQWSDEQHAGFSDGTPWIPVAANYEAINAKKALEDSDSIFSHYQQLVELRKKRDIITYGDYQLLLEDDNHIFAYTRNTNGETLLVISNFYAEEVTTDIKLENEGKVELVLSNYADSSPTYENLTLRPFESVVYSIQL